MFFYKQHLSAGIKYNQLCRQVSRKNKYVGQQNKNEKQKKLS